MGRRCKPSNYRQFYKDYYDIEFGSDMVVHHIDFDRSNNEIDNLLLLPNKLHTKYHYVLSMLLGLKLDKPLDIGLRLSGPMVQVHYSKWLRVMAETLDEIYPWMQMKVNFEMMPDRVFKTIYHTGEPITERSVWVNNGTSV